MYRFNLVSVIALGAMSIASASIAAPATPSGGGQPPAVPGASAANAARVPLADIDRDGISDGLQSRLTALAPSERIDVVVQFRPPFNLAAAEQAVGAFDVRRQFTIISGFAATMTAAQVRGLSRAAGIVRIEEDFEVRTRLDFARPDLGVDQVQSSLGLTGAGIGVCIVDTGVDPNHEQLNDQAISGTRFADFVNSRPDPYDDHGHGTHVASIVAGDGTGGVNAEKYRGVAPGAIIYAAKVLNSGGSGSDSAVIAGVEWCASQSGVRVISMSLGSGGPSDGNDALSQAVDNAVASPYNKIVVVAAGNTGPGPQTVESPGAAAGALTVGAIATWSGDGMGLYLSAFSSRGPTLASVAKPDITAPGVRITAARANTGTGYIAFSGTSMATPYMSGVAALVLSAQPTMSPNQIKNLLKSAAVDFGATGQDSEWGAGVIDAYLAVQMAQGCSTCVPSTFPTKARWQGERVNSGGERTIEFSVNDLNAPIAAIITIAGQPTCPYGVPLYCDILGGWEWDPDFDAELLFNNNSIGTLKSGDIVLSECQLSGEWCGLNKGAARQETLHYKPTATGTYQIRVYSFAGGGTFDLDLATGPVGASSPPPPPPSNESPIAMDDAYTTGKNSAVTMPVLSNDFTGAGDNEEGDSLTVSAITRLPINGSTTVNSDGTITYKPKRNFTGTDSFDYEITDSGGLTDVATVMLTVASSGGGGKGGGKPN